MVPLPARAPAAAASSWFWRPAWAGRASRAAGAQAAQSPSPLSARIGRRAHTLGGGGGGGGIRGRTTGAGEGNNRTL